MFCASSPTPDHYGIAAPVFRQQAAVGQLLLDPVDLRVGLVDLVDRHDDRHLRRAGVIDRFDRLRHDAVVRRDHQNDNVRDLGAASPHRVNASWPGVSMKTIFCPVLLHDRTRRCAV